MKIYGLCLSNTDNGVNRAFLDTVLGKKGGEVISLAEIDFPMFKMGIDTPDILVPLCEKLKTADAIIIASPEYNGTISPFGKNVLDWISTQGSFNGFEKSTPLSGIPVMLAGVAPGPLGGVRALPSVSAILTELGCVVVKTFATTGGFNRDTYDYKNAYAITDAFLETL